MSADELQANLALMHFPTDWHEQRQLLSPDSALANSLIISAQTLEIDLPQQPSALYTNQLIPQ